MKDRCRRPALVVNGWFRLVAVCIRRGRARGASCSMAHWMGKSGSFRTRRKATRSASRSRDSGRKHATCCDRGRDISLCIPTATASRLRSARNRRPAGRTRSCSSSTFSTSCGGSRRHADGVPQDRDYPIDGSCSRASRQRQTQARPTRRAVVRKISLTSALFKQRLEIGKRRTGGIELTRAEQRVRYLAAVATNSECPDGEDRRSG